MSRRFFDILRRSGADSDNNILSLSGDWSFLRLWFWTSIGSKLFYQVALWDHGSASGDHVVWFPVLCHNVLSLSLYDSGSSYLQSQHYLDVPHWAFSQFFRSCQLSDRSALCHGQGFHIYLRIPLSFYRLSQWVHQTWSLLIPVIKHWIFVHQWNLLQTCTRLAFSRDFPCLLTRPPSLIRAFQ